MYRSVTKAQSLDQQYLDFVGQTNPVFARYPQIEPLRLFVFKELLVQRSATGWAGYLKRWLRPLWQQARTNGQPGRAEALIFIESQREVIVEALLPVYRELTSRGIRVQLVSFGGPDDLPSSVLQCQFPARARQPIWTTDAWEALCELSAELRARPLALSFANACVNLQSLFDELHGIMAAVQPAVVLLASTQLRGGGALAVACRSHETRTLLLQHGILQSFYTPLLTDCMLTWGESSNRTLTRLGISTNKLVTVGSPRHDSMVPSRRGEAKGALLHALSLPARPTFAFFSNGNDLVRNGHAPAECAQWLEAAAAQYADEINIVVRLHPNEDGALYRNCPHLHLSKQTPGVALTLEGCDWVGSLCSTVLYDALLYQKPVWQFYADGWPELADNWKEGFAVRISSQAELSESINRMLRVGAESSVEASLADHVFAHHGRATQAVADLVECQLNRAVDQPAQVAGAQVR